MVLFPACNVPSMALLLAAGGFKAVLCREIFLLPGLHVLAKIQMLFEVVIALL